MPTRSVSDRTPSAEISSRRAEGWRPDTWRFYPVVQMPSYPDKEELAAVERKLASYPPLVFRWRARRLKADLAKVARGEPSCFRVGTAPRASTSTAPTTSAILPRLLQMAVVLTFASGTPMVKLGRIARQFAKPRSSDFETVDGVDLPSLSR